MYYSTNSAQKEYIRKAIKADIRLDGRKTTELKKTHITKGT
jgi:exosome complex RNA-binding protein Rrp42 (RNase PH superfamily)